MEQSIKVFRNRIGKGVLATRDIKIFSIILEFEKNFIYHPTNYTLRVDEHTHQLSTDIEAAENFINHSCEPNAYLDFDTLMLKALKPIRHGEEITYNYFTSDWDGEDVFECTCGSSACKRYIRGFKYLTHEERQKIKNLLSPFLQSQFTVYPEYS